MKKGKTIPAAAIAAALLGTTMMVAPSEAQARRHDGASNGSYANATHSAKKKVAIKNKRYTKKRVYKSKRYAHNRSYRKARYANRSRVRASIPVADRRALYAQRAQVAAAMGAQPKIQCGFIDFRDECHSGNTAQSSGYSSNGVGFGSGSNHMRQAQSMVGMTARQNRGQLKQIFATTLNKPVDPARTPWCAAWANAVLAKSGIQGTGSLLARSFLGWGRPVARPSTGDVVVMARGRSARSGHVGFFVERQVVNGRAYVKVLGGNQGRAVKVAWYPESKVLGYRRAG